MPYNPNNPYIPGDPYSYDLEWIVGQFKKFEEPEKYAEAAKESAEAAQDKLNIASAKASAASQSAAEAEASAQRAEVAASGVESYVDTFSETINNRLEGIEEEQSALDARMDSFTTLSQGSTTGDAELIDGRVSYDGVTYPNIGTAIRSQAAQINSTAKIALIGNGSLPLSIFEKGSISANGSDSTYNQASRIRTKGSLISSKDIEITAGTGTTGISIFLLINGAWEERGWLTGQLKSIIPAGTEFRLLATLTTGANTSATIEAIAAAFGFKILPDNKNWLPSTAGGNNTRRRVDPANIAGYNRLECAPGFEVSIAHDGYTENWQAAFNIATFQNITNITIRRTDNAAISMAYFNCMIYGLKNENREPIYVDASAGNDNNAGTASSPLKTINRAIYLGRTNIYAKGGIYNETLYILAQSYFGLKLWEENKGFSAPAKKYISLVSGAALTISAAGTPNIYQAAYTPASGSSYDNVFITNITPPTTQGQYAKEYNALLVAINDNDSKRRIFEPLLGSAEVLATPYSFTYTNGQIIINDPDRESTTSYYVPNISGDCVIFCSLCDKVEFNSVAAYGTDTGVFWINHTSKALLDDCKAAFSAKNSGFVFYNTDAELRRCQAYAVAQDGYNMQRYGNSILTNCNAAYCGDDGASHHNGCTSFIVGGEYCYCTDGAITPAYGSHVNIQGAYVHHSNTGVQVYNDNAHRPMDILISNLIAADNNYDVGADNNSTIKLANSYYHTLNVTGNASIVQYYSTRP